ncbi:YSIRK-targeted triacylglycerol lipase [Staphylococcus chromogenes]|uniref:YSIRK-targeted triacylglycerol lipase n=1 Tax=Staphylococcus chromogenes TaxID=46126 RepID=UPI0039E1A2A4
MKQTQRQHTFSIRKSVFGATSVIVASFIFIGGGHVAHADETNTPSTPQAQTTTEQSVPMTKLEAPQTSKTTPIESSQVTDAYPQTSASAKMTQLQPAQKSEDMKPVEPAQKSEDMTPVEPAQKSEDMKPVEPAQKSEAMKPVEPAQKSEDMKPVEPAQKSEDMTPVEPAQKSEDMKPVEPAQKSEDMKPVEPAQKSEDMKPIEPAQKDTTPSTEQPGMPLSKAKHKTSDESSETTEPTTHTTEMTDLTKADPSEHDKKTSSKAEKSNGEAQVPSIDSEFSRVKVKPSDKTETEYTNEQKSKTEASQENEASLKSVDAPKTKDTTTKAQFTKQANEKAPLVKKAPDAVQNPEHPKNKDPFVFVHGFNGFVGDVAAKGENYWGGTKANLQNHLRESGYEMYEASVSALASNHERAVELYYFLKGGRVDYGAAHSEKFGHERYGKTYEGVLKDWKPGNPVHFIGHSMGGQTIRLLEHYLRFGDSEEIAYQKAHGGEISDLFKGGHDHMVKSITTLATPHNGTHASDGLGNSPIIRNLLYSFAKTSSNLGTIDFGLNQWGFKRQDGESLIDYNNRVAKSKIWDSEDTGLYDLTREGADKINQTTELNPNIYYKTYTGLATHPTQLGKQMVDLGIEASKVITGNYIGAVDDVLWRPNDGLVSVISSQHPSDEKSVEVNENSPLKKGTWQVMPTMKGWDHSDFVGSDALDANHSGKQLTDFYDSIADYLMRIEKAEQ